MKLPKRMKDESMKRAMQTIPMVGTCEGYRQRLTDFQKGYLDAVKQCNFCGHYTLALDAVADKVLAHKPKPKSKPARKRARRAKKIAKVSLV